MYVEVLMNYYVIGYIFNWTGNKLFPSEAKAKRDNLATVKLDCYELGCNKHSVIIRVELLPTFKFTSKTVKNSEFTDNCR